MSMLSLEDLDFENNKGLRENLQARDSREALAEIKETRATLGKFTVRDTMEAIYGTAYTVQMLGEEGGEDILMEELNPSEDIREAAGGKRRDIGDNRLPNRKIANMSAEEQEATRAALREQDAVADEGIQRSAEARVREDTRAFNAQKVAEDMSNMLPEQRDEIIRLLQEQAARENNK